MPLSSARARCYSNDFSDRFIVTNVNSRKLSYRPGPRIVFSLFVEPISFDIATALPAALILNEAISNAIKHAFSWERQGTISAKVKTVSENKVMLEVGDDGIGFSENEITSTKSFGLRLIEGLAHEKMLSFIAIYRQDI